ncbi:MAG: nicotinamide-nucleotide amidohydrolase family protein [Ruminiclostridium sp.]|nr:nicotinamide-nucleotide amidohydrolase family protein [Ruminiclostridium sp.]
MVTKLDKTAENVVLLLKERGLTLASAESCTGGLISAEITSVSGSSDVFGYGVCTYANEAKMKLLGVREETLAAVGAVSEETAVQMAEGVRKLSGADMAVSVTGIAGPTGGTPDKPVGTVYIGFSSESGTYAKRYLFTGADFPEAKDSREAVRYETAFTALNTVITEIQNI